MKKALLLLLAGAFLSLSAWDGILFREGTPAGKTEKFPVLPFEGKKVLSLQINEWGNILIPKETDWTEFRALRLECYASRANQDTIVLTLSSEPEGRNDGNYFQYRFTPLRTGWQTLTFPLDRFGRIRKPAGWKKIDRITFNTKGYGLKNSAGGKVLIREIRLLKKNSPAPRTVSLRPVNPAESMMCVFFDKALSDIGEWQVRSGVVHSAWSQCTIEWKDRFSMTRKTDLDVSRFDQLLFSIALTPGTRVRLSGNTDKGLIASETIVPNDREKTNEYILPLKGAKVLKDLTLSISSAKSGRGFLKFAMLVHTGRLKDLQGDYRSLSTMDMTPYLVPLKDFDPSFEPGSGIYCSGEDLERIRKQLQNDPLTRKRVEECLADLKKTAPCAGHVREYNARGRRFVRDRDLREVVFKGTEAAWFGVLLRKPELIHLAARRAIALALTPHWNAGVFANIPGCTFEHRVFDEIQVMEELAFALEFCQEAFTPYGRELIEKALAEKGLAAVNFCTWRWDYIFSCNQLAAFSLARVLSLLVLEKHWYRLKAYTDLAIRDLDESMKRILAPDGGYAEGSSYYQYTFSGALFAYYFYARARKIPFRQVLPPSLKNAGTYVELMMSTDDHQGFLPLNDGSSGIYPQVALLLAKIYPEGPFGMLYGKFRKFTGMPRPNDRWSQIIGTGITAPDKVPFKPFLKIDSMRSFASVRDLAGKTQKIFVSANAVSAAHMHPDAGHFLIEFDGETYAMDSGVCAYSSPFLLVLQQEDHHNVMVPVRKDGSYGRQIKLRKQLPWKAEGNEKSFRAEVDLTPCWQGKFLRRTRSYHSDSPEFFTVKDTWQLAPGYTQVRFFLLSPFEIRVQDGRAVITGKKGNSVSFALPANWKVQTEKLARENAPDQYRLTLSSDKQKGELEITFRFTAGKK